MFEALRYIIIKEAHKVNAQKRPPHYKNVRTKRGAEPARTFVYERAETGQLPRPELARPNPSTRARPKKTTPQKPRCKNPV